MSQVIDLFKTVKSKERYQERLEEIRGLLGDLEEELRTATINLAMEGPWREWNEQQPIGATANVSQLDIADTNDLKVTQLAGLLKQVCLVREALGPSDFD